MKYQLHLDTSVSSNVQTSGMPVVSKTDDNPFLTSILLYNNHRNVNTVELKSAEIPIGFYNIRSPYNTFVIDGITYTVPPGNYTIDTLIDAMNFTCPCIFSRIGNRMVVEQANPYLLRNFIASDATTETVQLNWTPPLITPESYILNSVPGSFFLTIGGSATSYNFGVFGVAPGTEITCYLNPIFTDRVGPMVASNPIFLVPPPDAVTGFVANNPTETTVDLAWDSASYAILYSIVSSPTTTTQTTSDTTYTFTDLTPSTEYTFTITPSNANNVDGPPTTSDPVTTLTPLPLPGAVTNFVASNPQDYSIDLAWDPALDASSYSIETSPTTTTQTTSDTTYTFTDLTPGTEYTFTITAVNATGDGPPTTSDPVSTLLPLPGTGPEPYNTFTDLTTTTIGLSWENGVTSYATSYNVYAYLAVPPVMIGFQNAPTSPYIYTGLQPNHKYYFVIKGVNATGEGEAGAGVFAYTVPEVTGFSAGNPQETTVDLTWDAPDISVINNIQWEITSTPTTTTQTASALNSFPIPYTFTGLTPDTAYTFTITPQVGPDLLAGDPVTSDPISTIPPFPGTAPVINNTPVSATTTTIELTWSTDPPYPPSYAASYNVYCHDAVTYEVLDVQSASLTPPYTFTGLQTNYGYSFNLSSVNARGEQEVATSGSEIMYTVPTVTGVAVSNPTETTVDITWDAITTNLSPGDFNRVITSTPETTTQNSSGVPPYTFTDLTPDTSYTFTVTPQVAYNFLDGDPVTSDPISTLLPLPGYGNDITVSNPTATSFVLSWDPTDYASSYELYENIYSLGPISVSGTTYTWTGLTPDTYFSFYLIPVNATGSGVPSTPTISYKTLIQVNLAYTGTIETLELRPGNYNFQMAGGSGPLRSQVAGGAGRCFAEYTFLYTVESTITIQYAIGQASPGDVGGAGGTYIYDQTNSQWLFIAGGAGTNDWSPNPADNAPGDGSGGAAGSGGGSGAGVNSNGSASTVSAGSGGLTFGNGGTGGTAGTFGDSPQPGGFGGGGGGTRVYDPDLPLFFGEYAYYPGGGGGYTGGTTFTQYTPEVSTVWSSGFGTSYMISGATVWGYNTNQGAAPVTNGYININIYLPY